MENRSGGWAAKELRELDLGDVRLNKRAVKLVEQLASKPTQSIPAAAGGWADTMAAYRFFCNEKASKGDILAPHIRQTEQRMGAHPIVLCLEDTTELDFNGQDIAGLGSLTYDAQRGMCLHPTYAVTPEREPLGVTAIHTWARERRDEVVEEPIEDKKKGKKNQGDKESARWINGYEGVAAMALRLPETRLIYVADREGDILALMVRAAKLDTPADWLIRARHNRCLPDGGKLFDSTCQGEPLGEITFTMPARDEQKARVVQQQLWSKQVSITAGEAGTIDVTCIIAREINAPANVKPVEWRLLTNRRADTLEEAVGLIEWYRVRWEIEIFFNVLKNGCCVEDLQLSDIKRLERALALFVIVAWRIAHLMRLGRICPDMDASVVFHPDEIRAAYILTKGKELDKPTLNEVLRRVAQLGGFLGRKGDGEPGVKTIWIGLQRIMDSAATIQALREN
jgi:hypothetical protein